MEVVELLSILGLFSYSCLSEILSFGRKPLNLVLGGACLFDSLHPSQQSFSYVGTGPPGLNQYLEKINVSCSRTQCSDAGEARTRNPC